MSIEATIVNAALAPLKEPLGWQGFAYGLLGLRFIKRTINWARGLVGRQTGAQPAQRGS